jgi:hypothetical protein
MIGIQTIRDKCNNQISGLHALRNNPAKAAAVAHMEVQANQAASPPFLTRSNAEMQRPVRMHSSKAAVPQSTGPGSRSAVGSTPMHIPNE